MDEPLASGMWRRSWERLLGDRSLRFAAVLLIGLGTLALLGPSLCAFAYDKLDWQHIASAPFASAHWLGTDRLGRDLYVRVLYGVRISLAIGIIATSVSVLIGLLWGATAGYLGGRIDGVMMRIVDVLNSLPLLFVVIAISTLLTRGNVYVLFASIGAVGWISMARIARGQALTLRHREFIESALVSGAGTAYILRRHVVPNVLGPVIVYAALTVPQMILYESFLSFLGLGVQEPLASLGSLIRDGANEIESAPWLLLVPASLLVLLLIGFNLLGDALRDALDPHAE